MLFDFFSTHLSFRLVLVVVVTVILMSYQWQQLCLIHKNNEEREL